MFELECLTERMSMSMNCNPNECEPIEITPCGPDYGSSCMPNCDPSDDC